MLASRPGLAGAGAPRDHPFVLDPDLSPVRRGPVAPDPGLEHASARRQSQEFHPSEKRFAPATGRNPIADPGLEIDVQQTRMGREPRGAPTFGLGAGTRQGAVSPLRSKTDEQKTRIETNSLPHGGIQFNGSGSNRRTSARIRGWPDGRDRAARRPGDRAKGLPGSTRACPPSSLNDSLSRCQPSSVSPKKCSTTRLTNPG